jgi:DNA-binding response OmpR family regulator
LILLIEDNQADAALVREALEEHDVKGELLLITDGDKAIRYIDAMERQQAGCPDLVILDLNLPKRSGREVLQSIRRSAHWRNTTVVVLSSSDARQDQADAMDLGARRYISKPLRLEEFLRLGAVFKELLDTPGNQSVPS